MSERSPSPQPGPRAGPHRRRRAPWLPFLAVSVLLHGIPFALALPGTAGGATTARRAAPLTLVPLPARALLARAPAPPPPEEAAPPAAPRPPDVTAPPPPPEAGRWETWVRADAPAAEAAPTPSDAPLGAVDAWAPERRRAVGDAPSSAPRGAPGGEDGGRSLLAHAERPSRPGDAPHDATPARRTVPPPPAAPTHPPAAPIPDPAHAAVAPRPALPPDDGPATAPPPQAPAPPRRPAEPPRPAPDRPTEAAPPLDGEAVAPSDPTPPPEVPPAPGRDPSEGQADDDGEDLVAAVRRVQQAAERAARPGRGLATRAVGQGGVAVHAVDPDAPEGAAAVAARATPLGAYMAGVEAIVARRWATAALPLDAALLGVGVRVTVDLRVLPSGRVRELTLVHPSGVPSVDAVAISAIPERLPRFPRNLDRVEVVQRVTFVVRGRVGLTRPEAP